jgi:fructoselysine-6-P-deglycase FrlB-like protein
MKYSSRFEGNIYLQPDLVRAALAAPKPSWMKSPKGRKIFFVGVGTNHHAARLTAWLWSREGFDARAVHSHDFVTRPYRLTKGDLAVFLSHRGSKSYTVQAEAMARRDGAETVIVMAQGCDWRSSPRRIETGPLENTGAFTQSFTTTMAWLLRWPDRRSLTAPFKNIAKDLRWGPAFPTIKRHNDVVLIGDGLREWVACEIALKLQETAYLHARSFGLEEFLHGPHISVGADTRVIGFSSAREKRWDTARRYLKAVGVPLTEVRSDDWLAQIIWGQRFTVSACKNLGLSPDTLRTDVPRYKNARAKLGL